MFFYPGSGNKQVSLLLWSGVSHVIVFSLCLFSFIFRSEVCCIERKKCNVDNVTSFI